MTPDFWHPTRVETGVALIGTAYAAMTGGGTGDDGRPEYRQFLPVDWHEHAGMRAAVECLESRIWQGRLVSQADL